ncbi:MAG: polyketide cyclase [Chitinophagia bacterium]|nr:polyketide cyclase [Chitinophagia bacterium]
MKMIRNILLVVAVLLLLPLIVALFVPKDYTVEQTVDIAKPRQEVFQYVRMLRNQQVYSVWIKADPNIKMVYTGTDGMVGGKVAWESNMDSVGKGEQTITKIAENERMDIDLHFYKPFPADSKAYFKVADAAAGATRVTWGFSSTMPYPMNLFLVLGMKEKLNNDLHTGLSNMKQLLEGGR